jgi:16S rRNA (uracil1498-N3)-methyltransferase
MSTARPTHAVFLPAAEAADGEILVDGHEARHALRVKRVRQGDRVDVLDGAGGRIVTSVAEAGRRLRLEVIERQTIPRPTPRVEVWSAVPKGPRLGQMIDQLSQVGADHWRPLETAYGTESMSPNKHDRLERVAVEALKQCGRGWVLEIGRTAAFDAAIEPAEGVDLVIADASGEPLEPRASDAVRLLVGPEGGWRDDELDQALRAGARACRFGPHVMRIETAAPAAVAVIRAASAAR